MAKVFGTEKLRGFAMSKHIGAHLLQADGSAQPASKAKPAAKKVVKKEVKKEESEEEEAADDSEEESPPPKKVAKKDDQETSQKKKNLMEMKPVMNRMTSKKNLKMTPLKNLMTKEFAYEQFCTLIYFFIKIIFSVYSSIEIKFVP